MEAIKKCSIDHCIRERREQMASFHKRIDTLIDIADKHHRGFSFDGVTSAGERAGRHVILHDLHAIFVFEGDPCHFIECHHVPHADQTNLTAGHIVKQVSHGGLPTRNQ